MEKNKFQSALLNPLGRSGNKTLFKGGLRAPTGHGLYSEQGGSENRKKNIIFLFILPENSVRYSVNYGEGGSAWHFVVPMKIERKSISKPQKV